MVGSCGVRSRALLGTDGSEPSRDALRRGAALLDHDADLTVACIAPLPGAGSGAAAALGRAVPAAEEDALGDARRRAVLAVASTVERLGVPARELVRFGPPGPTLCQLVTEGDFDVLVVGSHGTGLLERVLLGSVSRYVVKHAPCPVLVVRDPVAG
jgi:nucleotide-binding universal stress UspA family protein